MNQVWRHPSGGELWQGDARDASLLAEACARRPGSTAASTALVLAACDVQPPVPDGLKVVRVLLRDQIPATPVEEEDVKNAARYVAWRVARWVGQGRWVLVTCAAGLNRSGLISGLALRMFGIEGGSAVRKIRRARGALALSNEAFERFVLEVPA